MEKRSGSRSHGRGRGNSAGETSGPSGPETDGIVYGRHPVIQALRAGRSCQRVSIARGIRGAVVDEIFDFLRKEKIPYDIVGREVLERRVGATANHQGIVAQFSPQAYAEYGTLLTNLDTARGFLLFLDGIQDPYNLGAIVRSAHAMAVDAIVIPERGATGLTAVAVKAAAGAAAQIPVCRVKNLRQSLLKAKEAGLWIIGVNADGGSRLTDVDLGGPLALVIGGESKGLRRLVLQTCDRTVSIPMVRTEVGSFNASVAAGIVLFEVYRQRQQVAEP